MYVMLLKTSCYKQADTKGYWNRGYEVQHDLVLLRNGAVVSFTLRLSLSLKKEVGYLLKRYQSGPQSYVNSGLPSTNSHKDSLVGLPVCRKFTAC
jgi:hypothetical protein